MRRYQCYKVVQAAKIHEVLSGRDDRKGPGATLVLMSEGSTVRQSVSMSDTWVSKHNPQDGDYLVYYEDGYESVSPAAAFEAGYTLIKD